MTFKRAMIAGFATASLLLASASGIAQEAETPAEDAAPAADGVATEQATAPAGNPEDNWLKVCDPMEDGKQACIMRQVVVNDGNFVGSFLLRNDPGQESRLLAIAAVPLGVMLPFGMTWQIDNSPPLRLQYVLCDPLSCSTQRVINESYVNSLKKGSKLTLTAKTRTGDDLVVEIDLAGFTATYDNENAMTFEQFNQQSTGGAALGQALQDRAEQIRRNREGGEAPAEEDAPAAE